MNPVINDPGIFDVAVTSDTANPSLISDTNTLNVPSSNHLSRNSPNILTSTANVIANNAAFDLADIFFANIIAIPIPNANINENIGI